jgi:farnesyl-diphosphate farnesyltransferase
MTAELIGPLLHNVSRSFYLTLRVLPPVIRPQISLAYLLARASDTIADTEVVPRKRRLAILREIQDGNIRSVTELAEQQALPVERVLLRRLDECYRKLAGLEAGDQHLIAQLLHTITGGQIFDLERFPEGSATALNDDAETDRYTYMVAGCVGEFWTKMCRAHLPGLDGLNVEDGVRFGKGLQLVNILRDLPKDLRMGRCYLPVREPALLLKPENFTLIDPVYTQWLDIAVKHLDAGWRYTLTIPANQKRLRLACVWPIWIGLKTIARLRQANPLNSSQRVKILRAEVYWIMLESSLLVGNDAALDEKYQQLRTGTCS